MVEICPPGHHGSLLCPFVSVGRSPIFFKWRLLALFVFSFSRFEYISLFGGGSILYYFQSRLKVLLEYCKVIVK
jgi:hypothetical protein